MTSQTPPGNLLELIYCSRATVTDGEPIEASIVGILDVAREFNVSVGITGALMCAGGRFAQLLEGPAEAVESVFERICRDPRHHDVIVLSRGAKVRRSFQGWAMGLIATDNAHAIAEILLDRAFAARDETAATGIRQMLRYSVSTAMAEPGVGAVCAD